MVINIKSGVSVKVGRYNGSCILKGSVSFIF